jgi:hypothetical protein
MKRLGGDTRDQQPVEVSVCHTEQSYDMAFLGGCLGASVGAFLSIVIVHC